MNLDELPYHHNIALRAIGLSIRKTLNGMLTPQEEKWVARIEAVRRAMAINHEKLEYLDFGAGKSNSNRSREEMERGVPCTATVAGICTACKSSRDAVLLFRLVREVKPTFCLELGTCLGISAAYQAAALRLSGEGTLVTIEGAGAIAKIAKANLASLGLDNATVVVGRFQDELVPILKKQGLWDYAFIDGHHDGNATVEYFRVLQHFAKEDAVLVFDDIRWSGGMQTAWQVVLQDTKVKVALDLGGIGVCVLGKGST